MLLPFLFIIWLIVHFLYCYDYFVKIIENDEYRTFTHFLTFVGFIMWLVAIIIVNKSLYDLFVETITF